MKTRVIFRKFKNDGMVIAFFPDYPGDMNPYASCESYMHVGQHGAANPGLLDATILATEDEYTPLKLELESLGYDLKVCKRFSQKMLHNRIDAIQRVSYAQ